MTNQGITPTQLSDIRARLTLRPKRSPYYFHLFTGRSFGYWRSKKSAGRWVARVRVKGNRYREKTVGLADDFVPADGVRFLTYEQASDKARLWFVSPDHAAIRVEARKLGTNDQLNVCPIGSEYTVAHALVEFVEWRRQFRARQSLIAAISLANVYILPTIGTVVCSELTADQVRSVALTVESTARKRGGFQSRVLIDPESLSPEARRKRRITANNTLSILRAALKKAHHEDKIDSDKAWKFAHGFPRVDMARPIYLSWQEAKQLVDTARFDLRQLILAALYTGCRITELFRITAKDVLPNRMALYIHPQKNYRGRTIALPEEGYAFFRLLARERGAELPLLLRRDGATWHSQYVASHFRRLCRQLGHSDATVFHSLRHTYASLLLQAGTPPIVVSRQLGHISMATVIKTYAHVSDDFIDHEFRSRYKPGFANQPDLFSNSLDGASQLRGS